MTSRRRRARREGGFALVLAILALMLLTFLGLTLATTTSTELQISNNFRWGQQALYNAEAGMEVARAVLAQVADAQLVLPPARLGGWDPYAVMQPVPPFTGWTYAANRNGENASCDTWGNGMGFGQVLVDPSNPGTPFEDVHTIFGRSLSGNFTVWVRRDLQFSAPPALPFSDSPTGETVIVTSEGSAPFSGLEAGAAGDFMRANRAVRRLESTVTVKEGCRSQFNSDSQTGMRDCEDL